MRIGVNTLYLLPGKVGGSETYIANIIKWLIKLDKDNEYVVFINNECRGYFENISPNIKTILCPINASSRPIRILWEQLVLPFQLKKHKIDLLFSGGHTKPFITLCKSVLVIFDMQHVNQPYFFSTFFISIVKLIIYISAKTSDYIITISNNSKNELLRHYKLPSERVIVTYLSSDEDVFFKRPVKEVKAVKEKYNLPKRYMHYAAAPLAHKNHISLLKVLKSIKKEIPDINLVLTGARDYGEGPVDNCIKTLGLEDDVLFLGWLSFDEVACVYSGAELFVFPSLHEGFGMPVLEAMCTETPVVCSNIEPLKEIVADGALLFDPYDEQSMEDVIVSVLNSSDIKNSLISKGAKRAEFFTWQATAKSTLEVFNSFKL